MKPVQIAIVAVSAAILVAGGAYFFLFPQFSGRSPQGPSSPDGPVRDYVTLVDALRARGMKVEPAGRQRQPFFKVEAQVIEANGQSIQVFEFPDNAAMNSDASNVLPSGSIKTALVTWVDDPHFYKAGRIMVLYVGRDSKIMTALDEVLGPQFAGRR